MNGPDYVAVPYEDNGSNPNVEMEIGYIVKSHSMLSDIAMNYIDELKKYIEAVQ